jgi:hypothetical protein
MFREREAALEQLEVKRQEIDGLDVYDAVGLLALWIYVVELREPRGDLVPTRENAGPLFSKRASKELSEGQGSRPRESTDPRAGR